MALLVLVTPMMPPGTEPPAPAPTPAPRPKPVVAPAPREPVAAPDPVPEPVWKLDCPKELPVPVAPGVPERPDVGLFVT